MAKINSVGADTNHQVVDCISVAVDRYIVSFNLTDRRCIWKTVLCWFGLLGRFAWALHHRLFQR